MQFEHDFFIPLREPDALAVLCDLERVGPCLPGATVNSVEDGCAQGRVAVKLGAMKLTYEGEARLVEVDEDHHQARLVATAQQVGGNSTVAAEFTMALAGEGVGTRVTVTTEVDVTGRPAQMGRSLISSVGERIVGQFATSLSSQLAKQDASGLSADPPHEPGAAPEADRTPTPSSEPGESGGEAEPLDMGSLVVQTVWSSLRSRPARSALLTLAVLVGGRLLRRRSRRTRR